MSPVRLEEHYALAAIEILLMDADIVPGTDNHPNDIVARALESERSDVGTAPASTRRQVVHWLALTGILIAGNLANALSWRFSVPIDTGVFSITLALGLYVTPGWSEWRRSRLAAPGWRLQWRSVALALAAALVLALPSVIFFVITLGHGGLGYSAISSLSVPSLIVRELVEIPLLTAFLEELIFRQFIYRLFAQKTLIATILVNAGIFTLWHLVVNARTVMATNLAISPLLDAGAYLGSLATIFAGGVVFALVRWRTGSFVYSAITHWALLAILTLAMWVL